MVILGRDQKTEVGSKRLRKRGHKSIRHLTFMIAPKSGYFTLDFTFIGN